MPSARSASVAALSAPFTMTPLMPIAAALAEVALTVPLVSRSMPPSPAVKAANLVLPRLSPMPVAPPSEVALTSPLA